MVTAGGPPSSDLPGVNFYSPIGVISGLGTAGRGHLAALRAAAVPVSVVPVHELFVHQSSVGSAERRQRPCYPISVVHINADSVHRFLHFHARTFARAQYKIGSWVYELPAVQAMTAKPVIVLPYVVSAVEMPQPGCREKLQISGDAFVFLYVFDASSL